MPGQTVDTPTTSSVVTEKRTTFLINPGIDVFVIDRLSIGGEILFGTSSSKDETEVTDKRTGNTSTETNDGPTSTFFGFMPRVGYAVPLGSSFSVWPRGGFGFARSSYNQDLPNGASLEGSTRFWVPEHGGARVHRRLHERELHVELPTLRHG